MDKATQRGKILAYCKEHGSITVRDAFNLGINSPTKRISEMRLSGNYFVSDITEEKANDSGVVTRYKRYYIKAVET